MIKSHAENTLHAKSQKKKDVKILLKKNYDLYAFKLINQFEEYFHRKSVSVHFSIFNTTMSQYIQALI